MFPNRPISEFRKARACRTLCSLVLIFISTPAASQVLRDNCGNPDSDISIAGCTKKIKLDTAILKSGWGNPNAAVAHLATDYDSRGVAYANKGLYDQAIADYNQAISLLPKTFPIAYFNRGLAYHNQELDDQAIVYLSYNVRKIVLASTGSPRLCLRCRLNERPHGAQRPSARRGAGGHLPWRPRLQLGFSSLADAPDYVAASDGGGVQLRLVL